MIDNNEVTYKLQGIVYYGEAHFTSRVIYENGMVWHHDGLETGKNLVYEGTLNNLQSEDLSSNRGRPATLAIYVKC